MRMKIVLARIFIRISSLRERTEMSKGSREATESAEGATLRMGAAERHTLSENFYGIFLKMGLDTTAPL